MTQSKTKRLIAIILSVLAVALIVLGFVNMPKRDSADGQAILETLRIRTLLNATGEGVVESYVAIAKKEATKAAKAAGGGMAAIREAVAKAEEETRAKYSSEATDYSTIDTTALEAAVEGYTVALKAASDAKKAQDKAVEAAKKEAREALLAEQAAAAAAEKEGE
jgi:hypothetical protein